MRHLHNPLRGSITEATAKASERGFSPADFRAADDTIRGYPWYSPTPLLRLNSLASLLGIRSIYLKDERTRFGLHSFKALGAPYAAFTLIKRTLGDSAGEVGVDPSSCSGLTLVCASAGNHGHALAVAARFAGAGCVVYLPQRTQARRVESIKKTGAKVVLIDGDYERAVEMAAADAIDPRNIYVPDTASESSSGPARLVMLGYATLLREAFEQIKADGLNPPTHIFVQAGVGGLAGALGAYCLVGLDSFEPRIVVVEPSTADCLMQSAVEGRIAASTQTLATEMGVLACSTPSPLAWSLISLTTTDFISISDDEARGSQKILSQPAGRDPIVETTPAGAAGLAPLHLMEKNPSIAHALQLTPRSVVLGIITEGPDCTSTPEKESQLHWSR